MDANFSKYQIINVASYDFFEGKGDPDSPPRTPLHKSFHPPIMTETDGSEGEVTPVLVPVHKPPSRTNSVTTTQAIKGSSSGYAIKLLVWQDICDFLSTFPAI